jgi:hypothetical protein
MIDQTISHYRILKKFSEEGIGVVYKAQGLMVNSSNCVDLSPKGIGMLTEGNALGLHLPSTLSTLKGSNS